MVAIILIIAAIAIPNLLRSRIAANEASAVGSLRTLNTAEITYNTTYPNVGFACTLAAMGGSGSGTATSAAAGLIDANLASGTKSGYSFSFLGQLFGNARGPYETYAAPVTPGHHRTALLLQRQLGRDSVRHNDDYHLRNEHQPNLVVNFGFRTWAFQVLNLTRSNLI